MELIVGYRTNSFGDKLEQIGDILCNLNFWDCDCNENYIHHYTIDSCWRCGSEYEDMPPSREEEVTDFLNRHETK